jgi:hypothetical protein
MSSGPGASQDTEGLLGTSQCPKLFEGASNSSTVKGIVDSNAV